jgi:predicted GIY-YIG superfamily endonuclease
VKKNKGGRPRIGRKRLTNAQRQARWRKKHGARPQSNKPAPQGVWIVYGLRDPTLGRVFYVGCTKNPHRRLIAHRADRDSRAGPRCREIMRQGLEPIMVGLARFDNLRDARREERRLQHTPGLVNRIRTVRKRR